MRIYWGDLHSHCNISYGEGSLDAALAAAREHLDFCSVTGHAAWPDMPTDRERYARVIDYHQRGFARLRENWPQVVRKVNAANTPHRFVTFHSLEWHSLEYGDHNLYYPGAEAPFPPSLDHDDLRVHARSLNALLIPHHIGYPRGLRGANWDAFDGELSPFVEIVSSHGCAESDVGPLSYLHDMGPRVAGSTALAGLRLGHRFGFAGSTDNHAGYPGHYGTGLMGVHAVALTREALWEAFRRRRVYAVTGDRIGLSFWLNDGFMGDSLQLPLSSEREVRARIVAEDFIDHVEVIKNGRVWQRLAGPAPDGVGPEQATTVFKFRVEWGWGDRKSSVPWRGELHLEDGRILSVQPCFRGGMGLSPEDLQAGTHQAQPPNRLLSVEDQSCAWVSLTRGNPTPVEPATSAIVVEAEMPAEAGIRININGRRYTTTPRKLFAGSVAWPLRGWLSESVLIHRAVPRSAYLLEASWSDGEGRDGDFYYLRVAQRNNQWAWSSPIWVNAD